MSSSSFATIFAQVTNAASGTAATADPSAQQGPPGWTVLVYTILIGGVVYFALIRPQTMAKKKQEDTIKSARTGDKIVTSSGIHGVIANVKDTTFIVKVADNVKLELEKSHIDKILKASPEVADKV
jgi:preprotein translocase subunit YajC